MKCIDSPGLEDWQLVSYMDGEADDSVAAHMADCTYCREKADRWSRLQNRLRARLYRINCPSPMELGEYHLGLLTLAQARDVKKHLSDCPLCRDEVAKLDDYLDKLAPQPGLLEPKKVLLARLVGGGGGGQGSGGFSLAPAFAGLRGESKGPLTFEADGIVIMLDVQPATEGRLNIFGQVAADDQDHWTGAVVELQQADASQLTTSVDDLGAFRFEQVRSGSIQFTITSLHGVVIQGPDIEIDV